MKMQLKEKTKMKNKYYLLRFKRDYADEFDVLAQACFDEEEYNNWLNTCILDVYPNYEEKQKEWDDKHTAYQNFIEELKKRNLFYKVPSTDEDVKWVKENRVSYPGGRKPSKGRSKLHAYLGNYGECWNESYSNYEYARELVDDNIVNVYEVDKSFYETFHKCNLNYQRLCNIFELDV